MGMRDVWEVRLTRLSMTWLWGWETKVSRVAPRFQACTPVLTAVLIREAGNAGTDPA